MSTKKKSFEESMKRLEEIVTSLEQGDATLDASMKLFEEGSRLAAECAKQLNEAEQKVVRLTKGPSGEPVEAPFAVEEEA